MLRPTLNEFIEINAQTEERAMRARMDRKARDAGFFAMERGGLEKVESSELTPDDLLILYPAAHELTKEGWRLKKPVQLSPEDMDLHDAINTPPDFNIPGFLHFRFTGEETPDHKFRKYEIRWDTPEDDKKQWLSSEWPIRTGEPLIMYSQLLYPLKKMISHEVCKIGGIQLLKDFFLRQGISDSDW